MLSGYTKSIDLKGLFTSSTIYAGAAFANAALPFVLLPILTRHLPPEQYGLAALFSVMLAGLAPFVGASVEGAAIRKFYDPQTDRREMAEFLGTAIKIMVAIVGILLVSAVILSRTVGLSRLLPDSWLLLSICVAGCAFLFQLALGQLQVRKYAKHYGLLQIAMSVANLTLSLVLVVTFEMGAQGRVIAIAASTAGFGVVSILVLSMLGMLSFRGGKDQVAEALRLGVPLILHGFGTFAITNFDRYLVGVLIGMDELGVYMVAAQTAAILGIAFSAFNNAFVPWLFDHLKQNDGHKDRQIVFFTYCYFVACALGSGLAAYLAPRFIVIFAGESYHGASSIVSVLVAGQMFVGMYYMVVNYLLFAKKNATLSAITLISGLLNVGLIFLLYSKFGVLGVAYAGTVTMFLRFVITWWRASLHRPMPWLPARRQV